MRLLLSPLLLLFLVRRAGADLSGTAEAQSPSGLWRIRLNVSGSGSLFTTISRSDALASLKIYVEALGKARGIQFQTKLEIFNSVEEVLPRLRDNSLDLLVLDTPDYLSLESSQFVEPVAAGTNRGQLGAYQYLLLGRESPGATAVTELRGKRIVVNSRTQSDLGLVWIETPLARNRLGHVSKFFGRVNACVVDAGNGDLHKEPNPQLATPYRRELIDSIPVLHNYPAGAQMALVFKPGPMVRVGREAFGSVRVPWSTYLRLGGPFGQSEAAAPLSGAARTPGGSGFADMQLEEAAGKERP